MGSVTLKTNQTVVARVQESVDGAIQPIPVGPFTWSSSSPEDAIVTPAADGLSAVVTPLRAGSASILVQKAGVTGSGQVTITLAVITLEVLFDTPIP
jgi:hypothetical protein